MALIVVGALLGLYALICVTARIAYPKLLFPAPRVDVVPHDVKELTRRPGGPRIVDLTRRDGLTTKGIYFPAAAGQRTVLVFHGNGATMFDEIPVGEELSRRGLGALLVEYRGYGLVWGDPPEEASLYADAEAAVGFAAGEGVGNDALALWGSSLGTSVAGEMASRGHGVRLVLFSPFTSILAMGAKIAPILPVRLLMSHRLDTLSKATRITQTTLVIHGEEDEIVPFAMGKELASAIVGARFVPVAGGHHNDLLVDAPRRGPSAANLFELVAKHLSAP